MGIFKENNEKFVAYLGHSIFLGYVRSGKEEVLVELLNRFGYSYIGEFLERYDSNEMTDMEYTATLTYYKKTMELSTKEIEIYKWQRPLIETNLFNRKTKTAYQELLVSSIKGSYTEGDINSIIAQCELYELLILLRQYERTVLPGLDFDLLVQAIVEKVTGEELLDLPTNLLTTSAAKKNTLIKKVIKSLKTEEYDESLDCGAMQGLIGFTEIWDQHSSMLNNITKMSWIATMRKKMNILVAKVEANLISPEQLKEAMPTEYNVSQNYNVKEVAVVKAACVKIIELSKEHIKGIESLFDFNKYSAPIKLSPVKDLNVQGLINLIEFRDEGQKNSRLLKDTLNELYSVPSKFDVVAKHFGVEGKQLNYHLYKMGRYDLEKGDEESVDYIMKKLYFATEMQYAKDSVIVKMFFENDRYKKIIENSKSSLSKESDNLLRLLFNQSVMKDEPNQYWEMFLERLMKKTNWLVFLFEMLDSASKLPEYMLNVLKVVIEKFQRTYKGNYNYRQQDVVKKYGNPAIEAERKALVKMKEFVNDMNKFSKNLAQDYDKTQTIIANKDKFERIETIVKPEAFYSVHSYGTLAMKLQNEEMINTYKETFKESEI